MRGAAGWWLAAVAARAAGDAPARPSRVVWDDERLGRYTKTGGRHHERPFSLAVDRGLRRALGLDASRCDATLPLGTTSDGGKRACLRGLNQTTADRLACASRFDRRYCPRLGIFRDWSAPPGAASALTACTNRGASVTS